MEQTNRTILFEEVNPDKMNLLTVLGSVRQLESLSDEDIAAIEREFVVYSFEELLEKFRPVIYMTLQLEKAGCDVSFSKPGYSYSQMLPVFFDKENQLLSMFTGMMDYKITGRPPMQKASQLAEYILPMQDLKGFIALRRKVKELFVQGEVSMAEAVLNENTAFLKNSLLQLQFLIEEAQLIDRQESIQDDFIRLSNKDELQIEIVYQSEKFQKRDPVLSDIEAGAYAAWLEEYLNHANIPDAKWVRINLLSMAEFIKMDQVFYLECYNQSLDLYEKAIKSFWNIAKPFMQTLLGIRTFFAQYSSKKGRMSPALFITNCSMDQLMDVQSRNVLKIFLETVNQKNTNTYTIWYAILPRLYNPVLKEKRIFRERFTGNGEKEEENRNDIDTAKLLIQLLAEYKIQMFLSIEPSEETTFYRFSKEGMESYYKSFQPFEKEDNGEYLVPCYPNFRLLLREQARAILGMQYELDEFADGRIHRLTPKTAWLSAVYIDAAYVAAGLIAACQCPDYLMSHYPDKVNEELPGVAYRMLEDDNRLKTKTVMAKEIWGYEKELKEQIVQRGSGIIFACEEEGITVLTDRTMAYLKGNPISLSHIQTMTYIERTIRTMTQDYKDILIKQFFTNRQNSKIHQWLKDTSMINSLFRKGETMDYHINEKEGTCDFEVNFIESVLESKVQLSR